MYSFTRRSAPGGKPPRATEGGTDGRRSSATGRRGRVCKRAISQLDRAPGAVSGGVISAGNISAVSATVSDVAMSPRSLFRNTARSGANKAPRLIPSSMLWFVRANIARACRSAPAIWRSRSTARSIPDRSPSLAPIATIHSRRNRSRKQRSSMARADNSVSMPVRAWDASDQRRSIDETSKTAASFPLSAKIGAPEQLSEVFRARKC